MASECYSAAVEAEDLDDLAESVVSYYSESVFERAQGARQA
jgi:hypothetical protein